MSEKNSGVKPATHGEFDSYRLDYSDVVDSAISFSGLTVDRFTRIKARYLTDIARELSIATGDHCPLALDVGCGTGLVHNAMEDARISLFGVDVSEECLHTAARSNPSVRYAHFDGARLPFPSACFDITWTICVLHHLPPEKREKFCTELVRVLKPGGQLVVIEHNPFNPLTRWAVSNCEFDQDAQLLRASETRALFEKIKLERVTTRYIETLPLDGPFFAIDRMVGRLPVGAQYICAGSKSV